MISGVVTNVSVANGAHLTVGDGLTVQAISNKDHNVTSSAGAYEEGSVGIGVTVSLGTTNTTASLGGTVSATGSINVDAQTNVTRNTSSADASVGSGLFGGAVIKAKNAATCRARWCHDRRTGRRAAGTWPARK